MTFKDIHSPRLLGILNRCKIPCYATLPYWPSIAKSRWNNFADHDVIRLEMFIGYENGNSRHSKVPNRGCIMTFQKNFLFYLRVTLNMNLPITIEEIVKIVKGQLWGPLYQIQLPSISFKRLLIKSLPLKFI